MKNTSTTSIVYFVILLLIVVHPATAQNKVGYSPLYLGNNVNHAAVYDTETGGCRDGLGRGQVNPNQGAESTISYWIARCELELLDSRESR